MQIEQHSRDKSGRQQYQQKLLLWMVSMRQKDIITELRCYLMLLIGEKQLRALPKVIEIR